MVGVGEVLVIVVVAMLFFGASRLPKIGRSIGAALRELKKGMQEGMEEPGADPGADPKPPEKQ